MLSAHINDDFYKKKDITLYIITNVPNTNITIDIFL
jgi:hypothetical protein